LHIKISNQLNNDYLIFFINTLHGGTMPNLNELEQQSLNPGNPGDKDPRDQNKQVENKHEGQENQPAHTESQAAHAQVQNQDQPPETTQPPESRPVERNKGARPGARGTAAMDPQTRQEVARKGGLAVSRNKQHMAEIGRKGGQSVSKNREHMAQIGRKGGAASRGHR
jgi:general stress protein YciG